MEKFRVKDILLFLEKNNFDYIYYGDDTEELVGFSPFADYKKGTVTWIRNVGDISSNELSNISLAIVPQNSFKHHCFIYTENPRYVFFCLMQYFSMPKKEEKMKVGRGNNVFISEAANIDDSVVIGHNCIIGDNVMIGRNTIISNNVVLENVVIGEEVIIKSGTVIGERGFGYVKGDKGYIPIMHQGKVCIGNRVEIGSNVCIDRGVMEDTIIEEGVKIDNLCHIAHNVHIGKNSMIIAHSMIGGSAEIGEGAYIAPGTLIMDHRKIGKGSIVGMGTVVIGDVLDEDVVIGVPAKKIRKRTDEELKFM